LPDARSESLAAANEMDLICLRWSFARNLPTMCVTGQNVPAAGVMLCWPAGELHLYPATAGIQLTRSRSVRRIRT
jgi:hypothetical protein